MKRFRRSYQMSLVLALAMLGSMVFSNHAANAYVAESPSAPLAGTVVVSPVDMHGWLFYDDELDVVNNSLGTFVNGPANGAPVGALGTGSAQIRVAGTQRRNLGTYQFSGTLLANINELKFSTYNPSAGNPGNPNRSAYLNFNVDFNLSDTWQNRLVFLPTQNGTVVQNTWQEWNAALTGPTGSKWQYSGATWPGGAPGTTLKTWSQIISENPNVRIKPTDSFLGIRVGEPYASGYTENIDNFKFGTIADGTTTFDFEHGTTRSVCAVGGQFATIQAAVNVSLPGDLITVCNGTYAEQLDIDEAITIRGASQAGTIIQSPPTLATKFTTGSGAKQPVVYVHDVNAVIQNLTVDGMGVGNANIGILGVAFHNAGGTIDHTTVTRVRDTPFNGAQHGVALYAYNTAAARTLNVDHNTLSDYQKNGTVFSGAGLTVNFTYNTVNGQGPTTLNGQNGVQYSGGATGTISDNTVIGNAYTPGGTVATGLLLYDKNVDVLNNVLTGNEVAVYHIDSSGINDGNIISASLAGPDGFYGIVMDAPPPGRNASPYDAVGTAQNKGGEAITAVQVARATNNILNSTGIANSIAIETDGGFGADSLDVYVSDNTVNNWGTGIAISQCTTGCVPGSNFTSVIATRNTVTNNDYGIWVDGGAITPIIHLNNNHLSGNSLYGIRNSSTSATVDGSNNWWGDASGPVVAPGPAESPLAGDNVGPNVIYNPFSIGQDYVDLGPTAHEITVVVGQSITLPLTVHAPTAAVSQQSYLTFPRNLLQASLTPVTGSFPVVLQNNVCNGTGTCAPGPGPITYPSGSISFASSVVNETPAVPGNFTVAQITFTGTTVGDATVHSQFTAPDPATRNSKVAGSGDSTLSDPTFYDDYIIHVVYPQFTGNVIWQGRDGLYTYPNAHYALPIKVMLTNNTTNAVYAFETTTDASSNFSVSAFGLPTADTYSVRVKGPQYLSTVAAGPVTLTGVANPAPVNFSLQPVGDANNDNLVNVNDFGVLYASFGCFPCNDLRADFTGDELVGINDFPFIPLNFGRQGNRPADAPSADQGGNAVLEMRMQGKPLSKGATIHVGETVVLELWANASPGTKVTAQQSYVTFPANLLRLGTKSGITSNKGSVAADNSVLEATLQNGVCNGIAACVFNGVSVPAGSLSFASGTFNQAGGTGAFRIGSVTVQATRTGTALLQWQFSPNAPANRNTNIVSSSGIGLTQPMQFLNFELKVVAAGK